MKKAEIQKVIEDLNRTYRGNPPIELIAEQLNLPVDEAKLILQGLEKEKIAEKKKKKDRIKFDISHYSLLIIKIFMGIIGIGASIMSCYYTSIWLFEFLPTFLGIFLSLLMIMFSVLSFQLIILFWESSRYMLITVFSVLWIIVAMFSMGSTVAGQYNKRALEEKETIQQSVDYSNELMVINLLKEQEQTLIDQINEKKETKENVLSLLEEYKDIEVQRENRPYYNDLQWRMTQINKELNSLNEQLTNIRNEIKNRIIENPEIYTKKKRAEIKDFYVWLGGIISVPKDIIQFWLSIFPALFIDIIAPTGLAIAFFLKSRREI